MLRRSLPRALLASAVIGGGLFPAAAPHRASARTLTLNRGPAPDRPAGDPACATFGPGFVRLPGTDSCVRVSGSMRAGAALTSGSRDVFVPAPGR